MKKNSLYLILMVVIITIGLYFARFRVINNNYNKENFSFNMPNILPISAHIVESGYIGNCDVWGVESSKKSVIDETLEKDRSKLENVGYIYKNIDGIPSLCRTDNAKYRWEFYGTVYKNRRLMAIFFNPALKDNGTRLAHIKTRLDKNLFVTDLRDNDVKVEYRLKNKKRTSFELKIFTDKKTGGKK